MTDLNNLLTMLETKSSQRRTHKSTPTAKPSRVNVEPIDEALTSPSFNRMESRQVHNKISALEIRNQELEEENAKLRAENQFLREQLETYKQSDLRNKHQLEIKEENVRNQIVKINHQKQHLEEYQQQFQKEVMEFEEYKRQQMLRIQQLEAELQQKYDQAQYQHQLMLNKIQAYHNKPELQYREEYPEYFQTQVMDMQQTERHNREIKHAHHTGELERTNIEEKRKTQELIDQPIKEFNQIRSQKIKQAHESLMAIAQNKHHTYREASELYIDFLNGRTYYLIDKVDETPEETNAENEKYYMKYLKQGNNIYLYISPKY